ncbi:MAG: SET domain-containing protein-lysine N-methyltransferase [Puniceicoccales bacterium]|jgi:SET domain-containing protein|nr:SET domain-containing protein-lysine N-methyltransferase [Puniceicoccales bacterium]
MSLLILRQSPVHGMGLFASRPIQAGARVIEYKGRRLSKAALSHCSVNRTCGRHQGGRVFLFELDGENVLDGGIPDNLARFINHSCDENCEAILQDGRVWIRARRDIPDGEELTFDYAYALEHFLDHPCRCGAPDCTGFIVARADRPRLRSWLARTRSHGARHVSAAPRQR